MNRQELKRRIELEEDGSGQVKMYVGLLIMMVIEEGVKDLYKIHGGIDFLAGALGAAIVVNVIWRRFHPILNILFLLTALVMIGVYKLFIPLFS